MSEPIWLERDTVLEAHQRSLSNYGGMPGIRDEGLLDSALARPQQLYAYTAASLHQLAAAYALGLCKNHAFFDGNKRTAFIATYVFLALNGYALSATQAEATTAMLALAAGEMDEAAFVVWLVAHSRPK